LFLDDKPLVVQFAANNGKDFADATELVAKSVVLFVFCETLSVKCELLIADTR
jgi:hypothetical protein